MDKLIQEDENKKNKVNPKIMISINKEDNLKK